MTIALAWSERKRSLNLKQHGLDFIDAPAVFVGLTFTYEDDRFSYQEQRFVTLGLPYVRTSVDHGTALDLSGTGRADAGSLFAATRLALDLAAKRRI